ncbi:MAG: hypothetical protein V5A76_02900 [Candidatus Thermoplasmatota archaeon]
MNSKILSTGMVMLILGLFLILAFWPFVGVSGEDLADDQVDLRYESYEEDDTVIVYGTITAVDEDPSYIGEILKNLAGGIPVELEDELIVILANQNSTDLEVGDDVYGRLTLNEGLGIEYWAHDEDLRSKRIIDYSSYGLVGVGIAFAAVGVIKD